MLALRQGDLPRALPLLERAMALCQEMAPGARRPANFLRLAGDLGAAYTLAGRLADAVPLLTRAVAAQSTTAEGEASGVMRCRLFLGEAQRLAGHLEEAHTLAEQALTLARAHHRQGLQAYALRLLGAIAARRKPLERDKAEEYSHQARARAEELGMRPLVAHCRAGLGTLYAQTGHREQARVGTRRGHRTVPGHGDDVLAPADGGRAGAGALRMKDGITVESRDNMMYLCSSEDAPLSSRQRTKKYQGLLACALPGSSKSCDMGHVWCRPEEGVEHCDL